MELSRTLLLFTLPFISFAQVINTISGNGNSSNSSLSYTQALNYQAGSEVIQNPSQAKESGINIFLLDKYLYTVAKVRKIYQPKPVDAKTWKIKLPKSNSQSNFENQQYISSQVNKPQRERIIGYCEFDRTIKVYGNQKMFVNIPCWFEGVSGEATLFGVLIPKLKNYSLVLKPIEVYTNSEVYRVVSGYALSGDRSSPNIASEINLKRIEKILAKTGRYVASDMRDVITETAKGTQQQVTVNGDVVVKKSELNLNLLGKTALLDSIVALAQGIADEIDKETSNIPITFKIERGSLVFVNAIIEPEKYQTHPQTKSEKKILQNPTPVVKTLK